MTEYQILKLGPVLAYETRQLRLAVDDIRRDYKGVSKPLGFIEENLRSKLKESQDATLQKQLHEILDIIGDCHKMLDKINNFSTSKNIFCMRDALQSSNVSFIPQSSLKIKLTQFLILH